MDEPTWLRTGDRFGGRNARLGKRKTATTSRSAAMKALGSVIYAARLDDGSIKFGWTEHFDDRLRWLSSRDQQGVELLAFKLGGYEDEQAIHAALVEHRLPNRREYYNSTPEVMAVVNDMRGNLGLPAVA